jgi:hypothetical protein
MWLRVLILWMSTTNWRCCLLDCMANRTDKAECKAYHEDYMECLFHKKEVGDGVLPARGAVFGEFT